MYERARTSDNTSYSSIGPASSSYIMILYQTQQILTFLFGIVILFRNKHQTKIPLYIIFGVAWEMLGGKNMLGRGQHNIQCCKKGMKLR